MSVVIPVYKGEHSLPGLMQELEPLTRVTTSAEGATFQVVEAILVYDNGPDGSAAVIRSLEAEYPFVRVIWLSRNFGQHSATLAGMASSRSDWIVTMDEDGQHNPTDIEKLIDTALDRNSPLVYGKPSNPAPHSNFRNAASKLSKILVSRLSSSSSITEFQSFRLILGEIGRSVAAYAGVGVYLDVALGWIASSVAAADIELRGGSERASGYTTRSLFSHFWRLILTSGTRVLRLVSMLGVVVALAGFILGIYFIIEALIGGDLPVGYTSTITVLLFSTGAILIALGVVAEYVGVAVNLAMGKPLYLIVNDPIDGPLGRSTNNHKSLPVSRNGVPVS
ncbi:glycosyltransferase [Cryobacterium mannosilyticum]|uniref:Glycosyltransferase n=1 Tax=Cryobacterium mannosilyticum TaxID=1259190 RepID=A0A4R8W470_9MICO|nr:glycosyltransferase [Cryobacterium mannosilyticum]